MTKGTEPFADVALGGLAAPVAAMLRELMGVRAVARLWAHDPALWKTEPEQVAEISERLGWLELPGAMAARLPELGAFADGVREAGFAHVVLCGMGGSSLWPEVLAQTFGAAPGYPRLIVLDSTVPAAVAAVDVRTEPGRTLYVISSKSGGTVEVMSFFAHFWAAVERAVGPAAGEHFVAITDPGTSLAELARSRGFRRTFLNPPDVGGRYSALSLFGLVPGVLIGLDLPALLAGAQAMARACAVEGERNPGLWLGAALGVAARAGRDKLTLAVSPAIDSLGLWLEQLLAESTGKEGRGILPVVGEPLGPPDAYGDDRLFVYLRLDGDANDDLDRDVAALRQAGQPVVTLRVPDRLALGAELVRWEVATAIASAVIGINPFDQPNVQESKDNTARLLKEAVDRRVLPEPPADLVADGLRFWGVCDGGEPHTEAPTTS
ncbi:MAG: glucose-6-phosphate isomerase, partial [Chloroflexi bacterium]|nr:glucose-6-phosphate isomerase [Chloroflexota bacterium]